MKNIANEDGTDGSFVVVRVHGQRLGWLQRSSALSWRSRGSRFGGCLDHLEFSKFKIWVTDLPWMSFWEDVLDAITVLVGL